MMHQTLHGEHLDHPPQAQGGLNINHTKSAPAWMMQGCPLGWAAAPSAIPSEGKSRELRSLGNMQGAANICCQTLLSFDKDKSVAYLTQPL